MSIEDFQDPQDQRGEQGADDDDARDGEVGLVPGSTLTVVFSDLLEEHVPHKEGGDQNRGVFEIGDQGFHL